MNLIRVFKDYGEYNLQSISKVDQLLAKIVFTEESEIELDLTECLPDYYATSKLIDKAIGTLKRVPGAKILRIVTDFRMGEAPLLNGLFLGSEILDLRDDHELDIETLRSRINPKLRDLNLCLQVSMPDNQGDQLKTIQLGDCVHEDAD